jgi:hypothetical protein
MVLAWAGHLPFPYSHLLYDFVIGKGRQSSNSSLEGGLEHMSVSGHRSCLSNESVTSVRSPCVCQFLCSYVCQFLWLTNVCKTKLSLPFQQMKYPNEDSSHLKKNQWIDKCKDSFISFIYKAVKTTKQRLMLDRICTECLGETQPTAY